MSEATKIASEVGKKTASGLVRDPMFVIILLAYVGACFKLEGFFTASIKLVSMIPVGIFNGLTGLF